MANNYNNALILYLFLLVIFSGAGVQSEDCQPSGKLKGKEGNCNDQNGSECCQGGKLYSTFQCSPKVTSQTPATLSLNSFQQGGDGGSPCSCDGKFHSDDTPVVAMSTGWFDKQNRCGKNITIIANGKRVNAMVVDECDSTLGCDNDHDFQPPCDNNIVDGSNAVWQALGIPKKNWGQLSILWTDATPINPPTSPQRKKGH